MIIFNINAVAQMFLAAIPGGVAAGIAWAVGADPEDWLFLVGALFVVPIDFLWRFAGVMDGEDEDGNPEPGRGVLNLVYPTGGGHLFFLPMWLLGGAATVLGCAGKLLW